MTKVRIVGGGLMGVLAAFEAHRLGCRDIAIHERRESVGGEDLPDRPLGLELRDEQLDFGPPGGPVRQLLEWHGVSFDGDPFTDKAAGGETPCAGEPTGGALSDWIRSTDGSGRLGRYCQWRLNAWLDEVDESAVAPLGLDGRPAAAAPREGLAPMFARCRRRLDELGVKVRVEDFVSPQRAVDWLAQDAAVVWTSEPAALFRIAGLAAPKPLSVTTPTYFFGAAHEGPLPARVRNFAAQGSVFAVHIYENRGQAVLAAEAVRELPDAELRREIGRLVGELGEVRLTLGDQQAVTLRPRRGFRSLAAARQIQALRSRLADTYGPALVTGAWEPFAPTDRFAGLSAELTCALGADHMALPAAA